MCPSPMSSRDGPASFSVHCSCGGQTSADTPNNPSRPSARASCSSVSSMPAQAPRTEGDFSTDAPRPARPGLCRCPPRVRVLTTCGSPGARTLNPWIVEQRLVSSHVVRWHCSPPEPMAVRIGRCGRSSVVVCRRFVRARCKDDLVRSCAPQPQISSGCPPVQVGRRARPGRSRSARCPPRRRCRSGTSGSWFRGWAPRAGPGPGPTPVPPARG
jgi:hypothetical protein